MISDHNPYLALLLNRPRFKRPMSKKARKLLGAMLEWSAQFHGLWGNVNLFLNDFEQGYDAVVYEDICHRYKIDVHLKQLSSKSKKTILTGTARATKEEVLKAMTLQHFDNNEWLEKQEDLLDNAYRVKVLTNTRARDTYNWLVENFLITDFTEEDVNKIAFLSDEKVSFDLIKKTALRVKGEDIHKCTMAYLYAVVRDIREKDEYLTRQQKDAEERNTQKLVQALQLEEAAKHKLVHKFDEDMRSRWEKERELVELARNLKKNE